jgi:pimeloyl-ACP methyl ester carboxylesterase
MRNIIAALAVAGVVALAVTAAAQPPAPAPASGAPAAPRPARPPQPALRMDWAKTAYDTMGPLPTQTFEGGPACTIFRPVDMKAGSPVIIWGNGTTQRPVNYAPLLVQLASYGSGTGVDMLACLDWLTAENAREGSPYRDKLDLTKVGAAGHSQGGGGTLMAGRDPRIKVTAPIMPYTVGLGYVKGAELGQHGPTLMLSGSLDTIAPPGPNQQPMFDAMQTPLMWLTLKGAGHLALMQGAAVYRGAVTAWFLYQLTGDQKAGALFKGDRCGYCTAADWTVQRKGGA